LAGHNAGVEWVLIAVAFCVPIVLVPVFVYVAYKILPEKDD
jgi:hypothetical protein